MPVQDFPGPSIEHHLHPLDLSARQPSEPRPFGEELAQQAVGVLVGASLPGTMRMRKVDGHFRLLGQEAVLPHFGALVVRQGAAELNRHRPQFAREGLPHRGRQEFRGLTPQFVLRIRSSSVCESYLRLLEFYFF